jgi:3-oxoacyl-[acyl-carrier-protein] synthase-3
MTDKIARKLKFPPEKVSYSIQVYGNTAAASIPLTIAHNFPSMSANARRRCLLSGFGVGLSWGTALVALGDLTCPPIVEC